MARGAAGGALGAAFAFVIFDGATAMVTGGALGAFAGYAAGLVGMLRTTDLPGQRGQAE